MIAGCGADGPAPSGATTGEASSTPTAGGNKPDAAPSGWSDPTSGGLDNLGGKCASAGGGSPKKLPKTGIEYCVKANPECTNAGAGCALYVTINTDGALFEHGCHHACGEWPSPTVPIRPSPSREERRSIWKESRKRGHSMDHPAPRQRERPLSTLHVGSLNVRFGVR